MITDKDEQQIIATLQTDKKSFAKLYERYGYKIRTYLLTKVNYDKFLADDLLSATFEKALKSINSYQWQGISFSAWIYKIANNTLIDYYRTSKKYTNTYLEEITIKDNTQNIEESVLNFDSSSRIKSLLNQLNKKEKEVIILKFYDGLTNKSIAERLDLTETNVSTIVYRALQKLRKIYQKT